MEYRGEGYTQQTKTIGKGEPSMVKGVCRLRYG